MLDDVMKGKKTKGVSIHQWKSWRRTARWFSSKILHSLIARMQISCSWKSIFLHIHQHFGSMTTSTPLFLVQNGTSLVNWEALGYSVSTSLSPSTVNRYQRCDAASARGSTKHRSQDINTTCSWTSCKMNEIYRLQGNTFIVSQSWATLYVK